MNRKPVLKTAVVGLGRIAWLRHLPQLRKHDGFDLQAVVDPVAGRLEEVQAEFHVPFGFRSTCEMYDHLKPDLVVVASPTVFHRDQVVEAFHNGCHVFCDKPAAMDLAQTDAMLAAMRETNRKLMVYQSCRFSPDFLTCRAIIQSGVLGKIFMIKRSCSNFVRRNDWQALKKNGGGMLNNYGAHFIDQLLLLAGEPMVRASCELRTIASLGDADDVVKVVLTTPGGMILDLEINMAQALPTPVWTVFGTQGTAVFDPVRGTDWQLKYFLPEQLPSSELSSELAAEGRLYPSDAILWHETTFQSLVEDPDAFYRNAYDYFALNADPAVPVEETREVMRVIEVCRNQAGLQGDAQ